MSHLHILFEHAAGYALFNVAEFEEVGMLLPQVEASVTNLSRFNGIVKLTGFKPFKTALTALENMNAISEGIVPEDLQVFLDTTFPKTGKKSKHVLGVGDSKLGAGITEALEIKCEHTGAVPEIMRGIRMHFPHLIKGFTERSSGVAQLGLGHSYSRAKVKFNINRVDNMIIQSIALLDQLDKDINTFAMRIREWYSYHFPELINIVPDNYMFARLAKYIKNRKELTEESLETIEEIVMDSAKARTILDASRSSMGMDINIVDILNIELFANRIVQLSEYRSKLANYLHVKMNDVAPNLCALIGDQVGARLISHAGSLTNLAKYPSSTVQILGAEKALFRALKTRGNTPKYGLLFHSTFIGRAGPKNKGRISRYLANKCSLASRIDCFAEIPSNIFGDKLKEQVEERLKFYETGDIPRKNLDVMKEAIEETSLIMTMSPKKRKRSEMESNGDSSIIEPKKKKKKNKKSINTNDDSINNVSMEGNETIEEINGETSKKKKKKKNSTNESMEIEELNNDVEQEQQSESSKKKKKKKSLTNESELNTIEIEEHENEDQLKNKKKKKKDKKNKTLDEAAIEEDMQPKKKKKKLSL